MCTTNQFVGATPDGVYNVFIELFKTIESNQPVSQQVAIGLRLVKEKRDVAPW